MILLLTLLNNIIQCSHSYYHIFSETKIMFNKKLLVVMTIILFIQKQTIMHLPWKQQIIYF